MKKKHRVVLSNDERERLLERIHRGRGSAQALTHARILLKADEGADGPSWKDEQIVTALDVSLPTVERVRRRFATEGLGAAVERRPARARKPRRLDGAQEAHLLAISCSEPPTGRARWSLRLLADRMVVLYDDLGGVSYETIRRTLKKTRTANLSGRKLSPDRSMRLPLWGPRGREVADGATGWSAAPSAVGGAPAGAESGPLLELRRGTLGGVAQPASADVAG